MQYQQHTARKNSWVAKPLNRVGDLNSWINRMAEACPAPTLGEIVWLNNDKNSVGYKAIGFRNNGNVIWQRGQVVWH